MAHFSKADLIPFLPKDRHDTAGAERLLAFGYPALAPVLPHLFQWLNTSGSEVELVVRRFFAELGAPAATLVAAALEEPSKPALKHCLLRHVLPSWPREEVQALAPQLERLLQHYDYHGLDIWALKLMLAHQVPTHDGLAGLEEWKRLKRQRLQEHLAALQD